MARTTTAGEKKPKTAPAQLGSAHAESGLFGPGRAKVKESIFTEYQYGQGPTASKANVWLIVYQRGAETYEQPYSIGNGWQIAKDGRSIISAVGLRGLPRSCNAMKYLVKPLEELGVPPSFFGSDPKALEGMTVILDRVEQEQRRGLEVRLDKDGKPKGPSEILVPVKLVSLPDGAEAVEEESDEEEEEEEEEEGDETPAATDDDKEEEDEEEDDEDEPAPTKTGSKKAKAPEAAVIQETAVEAIVQALSSAPQQTLTTDATVKAVRKIMKGSPLLEAVMALVQTEAFWALELGWDYSKKKQTLSGA